MHDVAASQYLYFTVSPEVLWGAVWIRQMAILPVIERHNFAQNIHWRIAGSSSHTTSLIPCTGTPSSPLLPPVQQLNPSPHPMQHFLSQPVQHLPYGPINGSCNVYSIFNAAAPLYPVSSSTVQQPSAKPSYLYSQNVTFNP
jgi:hypothetical protein